MRKNPYTTPEGSLIWQNANGELHRLDGPARITVKGIKEWFVNGVRHREGGPACVALRGSERWYQDGLLHRVDGPAVIFGGGAMDWFILGVDIVNFEHFQKKTGCSDEEIMLLKLKWGDITWAIYNRAKGWARRT